MPEAVLEPHPVAALFPMLPDDELAELAADIKVRGLLQPIVLDADGRVLDGRNRLAACELAEVEPTFVTYEGDDPDGYALAVNIARRHMTKGQQAMIAARWRLETKQSQRATAEVTGLNAGRIGQASVVLDHASDLVDSVVSGAVSLDAAYETARDNKKAGEDREAELVELRAVAPDLADQVVDETNPMTLAQAMAAWRQRRDEALAKAKRVSESLRMAINTLTKAFGTDELREQAVAIYVTADSGSQVNQNIVGDDLRNAADICHDLAKRWER